MRYTLPSLCLVAGIGIGASFSSFSGFGKAQKPESRKTRSGKNLHSRVDYDSPRMQRLTSSVLRDSKVPARFLDGERSVEEWVDLIVSSGDSIRMDVVASLISDDDIGAVVVALQSRSDVGSMRFASDSHLLAAWYRGQQQEALAWVMQGHEVDGYAKVGSLAKGLLGGNIDAAMKLYALVDFTKVKNFGQFEETGAVIARHLLESRSVEEFWNFHEAQVGQVQASIVGRVLGDLKKGYHEEVQKEIWRSGVAWHSPYHSPVFASWAKVDPQGLMEWCDRDGVKNAYKLVIAEKMLNSGLEDYDDYLREWGGS